MAVHYRVEPSIQPLAPIRHTYAISPQPNPFGNHAQPRYAAVSQTRPANVPQVLHAVPTRNSISMSMSPHVQPSQQVRPLLAQSSAMPQPVRGGYTTTQPQQQQHVPHVDPAPGNLAPMISTPLPQTPRESTKTQATGMIFPIKPEEGFASYTSPSVDDDHCLESNDQASEFMRLLDCLESRVDLMAELQRQKNCIQNRTKTDFVDDCQQYLMASTTRMPQEHRVMIENLLSEIERLRGLFSERQDNLEWTNAENEKLREQLKLCSGRGDQLMDQLQSASAEENSLREELIAEKSEVSRLKDLLSDERRQLGRERVARDRDRQEAARDRAEMLAEIEYLKGQTSQRWNSRDDNSSRDSVGGGCSSALVESAGKVLGCAVGTATSASAISSRDGPRESDFASLAHSSARSASRTGTSSMPGGDSVVVGSQRVAPEQEILARLGASLPTAPLISGGGHLVEMGPFHRVSLGSNITLSEDGYVATRTRGCRHSVVVGSTQLSRHNLGYYFELEVTAVESGWVNGLALGITLSRPETIKRMPDKAWRIPGTFVVGYHGCVFIDGKELRTTWRADRVPVGSNLGCLVSSNGDIRIFCDGAVVMRAEKALAEMIKPGVQMFPVVDVFSATVAVKLTKHPSVPGMPWKNEVDAPVTTVAATRSS